MYILRPTEKDTNANRIERSIFTAEKTSYVQSEVSRNKIHTLKDEYFQTGRQFTVGFISSLSSKILKKTRIIF